MICELIHCVSIGGGRYSPALWRLLPATGRPSSVHPPRIQHPEVAHAAKGVRVGLASDTETTLENVLEKLDALAIAAKDICAQCSAVHK